MENAPSVPPLFSSTPPPIDFDEIEEIEDSEFGIAADIEEEKTIDVPPASEFSTIDTRLDDCCYIPSSSPPPFDPSTEHPDDYANLVEAINVESIQKFGEPYDCNAGIYNAEDLEKKTTSPEQNCENTTVSETISPPDNNTLETVDSSCSDKSATIIHKEQDVSSLVTLEDVSDDSDNENLKKECRTFSEENDPNFFSIEVIRTANNIENGNSTAGADNSEAKIEPDVGNKVDAETLPPHINIKDMLCSENLPNNDEKSSTPIPDDTPDEEKHVLCANDVTAVFGSNDNFDDAEWGDVQFSSAPGEESHVQTPDTGAAMKDVCFHTAFDDTKEPISSKENQCKNADVDVVEDFDDDDDFGDFAAVTLAPPETSPTIRNVPLESAPIENIENCSKPEPTAESCLFDASKRSLEHLNPLLENVFPLTGSIAESATACGKLLSRLPMESVDSANALKYQWKNSEVRSCLIRSLGIDSRNILYGEKWNPSMPRFAANLSFDPLKPIKPQPTNSEPISEPPNHTVLNPQVTNDLKDSIYKPVVDVVVDKLGDASVSTSATTFISNTVETVASNSKSSVDSTFTNVADNHPSSDFAVLDIKLETPDVVAGDISELPEHATNNLENILYTNTIAAHPQTTRLESMTNSLSLSDGFASDGEVVTTSTFAGPLKETHIFTPSKYDETIAITHNGPLPSNLSPKPEPIDFDYEKAAAGIIINETVVKKEYRDIEYNPGFSLELNALQNELNGGNIMAAAGEELTAMTVCDVDNPSTVEPMEDEFCEFQSVPPPPAQTIAAAPVKVVDSMPKVADKMILCPSILLPQAISIGETKPKVEWGDSVIRINPEELARIEELFPQNNKVAPTKTQQQQPQQQQQQQSPTISGRIAQQENHNKVPVDEDDDWSDFLSVPITNVNSMPNHVVAAPTSSVRHQPHQPSSIGAPQISKAIVDDEWSDFVSNTPAPKETNLYKTISNNTNNNNTNKYLQNKTHHIVHDFSTSPTPRQQHHHYHPTHHPHNQQQSSTFQRSSKSLHGGMPTKLVPNISVIPTLGFSTIMTKSTYPTKK